MTDREIDVLVAGRVFADLVFTGVHAARTPAPRCTPTDSRSHRVAPPTARLPPRGSALTPRWSTELGDDPIGVHRRAESARRARPGSALRRSAVGLPDPDLRGDHRRPRALVRHLRTRRRTTALAGVHPGAGRPRRPRPRSRPPLRQHGCAPSGTTIVGGVGWDPSGQWSETLLGPSRRRRRPHRQRSRSGPVHPSGHGGRRARRPGRGWSTRPS